MELLFTLTINYVKLQNEAIDEVLEFRIKGLKIGLKITPGIDVKILAENFLNEKIIVGTAANNVIRLVSPYIIEGKNINDFVYILKVIFKIMNSSTKAS